jgi:beta-lactamase regulating signal transducer with metallopeptidase domain
MGFLFEGSWIALLLEYLIKSSMILSISIVLAFLLKKKSAGLRHLVLSVFLIGLLFLPILSTVTTGWETNFLPSWQIKDAVTSRVDNIAQNMNSSSRSMGSELENFEISTRMGVINKDSRPDFGFAVLMLWCVGLMILSIRIVLGLYGTTRLAREGKDLQDSLWKRLLYRFLEAVSLRRKIHLLSHDKTKVPLTWGVIKPIVMMPAESENWSENQRSTALYHELSHVKRGDYLVMILARISRALYWFNPLSWIVLGMIKREQEKACDELVLKAGIKPSTYAENLLFIRNSVKGHWNPPAAVLGAMNKSHLNDRLTTILKQRFNLKEVQMKTKVLLSLLAILSISFIGLARPGNTPETVTTAAWVDSQETTIEAQDQEEKEQEKEYEKGVKIEEEDQDQDQKEQKKEIKKGVKIEEKDKDKDQDKKKDKEKTTLVWTAKEGEKGTCKIIIGKDDHKKVLYVTMPEAKLIKGDKLEWTIKADKLHLSDDIKKIELDEGCVIYLDKEDKDGAKVVKLHAPNIQVKKTGKDKNYVTVDVHATPHVEVHPDVQVVVDTEKYAKLIEKIMAKLAKLKEKDLDYAAKKVDIEAIEKSLEELQKALAAKHKKSEHVHVHVSPKVSHSFKIRTKDVHVDGDKLEHAAKITDDKGMYTIIYTADIDTDQKEAYEKALKKLEGNLPEGFNLDSTFDDNKGTLVIKITTDEEAEIEEDTMKKLIEEFKKDLEKIKI